MLINNQNYLHGRLVGIGKIRKDGSREFRFLEKPINNTILRCGLNEFMTYKGSNSNIVDASSNDANPWLCMEYCGFGTGGSSNDFATTSDLQNSVIVPYKTIELRAWPFNGLYCGNSGTDDFYKIRRTNVSPAVSESVSVREIGFFKNYNSANHLFSRIVLPSPFQLDEGEQLMTTYELMVSYGRTPSDFKNSGLHDANNAELDYQLAQRYIQSSGTAGYLYYPRGTDQNSQWEIGSVYSGAPRLYAPFAFFAYTSSSEYMTEGYTLRYTKNSFDFPANPATNFNYRHIGHSDHCTNQYTIYTPDSFKRDVVVNVPAYWPEMTTHTDYRDIYAILFGTLYIRFGHFDANMDFTPAPWRKLASRTAKFVFRQSVATAESIAWQQNQNP